MTTNGDKIRSEVVACLIAADVDGDPAQLSMFGPVGEEQGLLEQIGAISDVAGDDKMDHVAMRLKALMAQEEFVGLSEVHPAWLSDVLSKESPRIIGIILRYLPSKQVRYIIEHLPKRIKHRLPQLIDSFAVPSPILKIIKERFERQFIPLNAPRDFDEFTFDHVPFLKSADLECVFRDIGIHELAMALKGVDRRSLHILLNRLSIDEARALQQRIRSLTDVSPSLLRDAKYSVLEINLAEANPDDLLMDVGLNAFAKTLEKGDIPMFPHIRQKLPPRLAYLLKRYIDEHVPSNLHDVAVRRKEMILGRIEALSRAGSIDENLARYFVSQDETKILPAPQVKEAEGCYDRGSVV